MKILSIEIQGFRSLREVLWKPEDLNVLIGPNGSGKSNALRILEVISLASRGRLGEYVQQEGGMEPLLWDGRANQLQIRLLMSPIDPNLDLERHSLTYELTLVRLGRSSAYRIESELLANFSEFEKGLKPQPFKFIERTPRHAVAFDSEQRSLVAQEAVSEEETLLSVAAGPFSANRVISAFQAELASWSIHQNFHTDREAPVRSPAVARTDTRIKADGQNLISVLHSLYTQSREFKQEIDTAMKAAFSEDFEELVFPPAADQRIQLRVRWKSLQHEQTAADLSDGTLRFLFLLAILANPNPAPLIAIDEPETGLHPSMLPIVAEYAVEASRRTQVVMTTHSPEFLDAFRDEAPATTVIEWRDGESQLRIVSGDTLRYWLEKYSLGELQRMRELESAE